MAVAPMTREENVIGREMRTYADSDGFLSRRQMRKSRYFTRGRKPLYLPLKRAYPPQVAIHAFPVGQGGCHRVLHEGRSPFGRLCSTFWRPPARMIGLTCIARVRSR